MNLRIEYNSCYISFGIRGSWWEKTFCSPTSHNKIRSGGSTSRLFAMTWNSMIPLFLLVVLPRHVLHAMQTNSPKWELFRDEGLFTLDQDAPAIQFIHILICFHWHMACHQLCIIIIIIIKKRYSLCLESKLWTLKHLTSGLTAFLGSDIVWRISATTSAETSPSIFFFRGSGSSAGVPLDISSWLLFSTYEFQ